MKVKEYTRYRVEIEVDYRPLLHWQMLREMRLIKESVIRHIDGCSNSNVSLEWDTREICSFCHREWDPEMPDSMELADGTPICCQKATEEFIKNQAETPKTEENLNVT